MVTMSSGREFLSGHGRGRVPAAYVNLFCWIRSNYLNNSRARPLLAQSFRAFLLRFESCERREYAPGWEIAEAYEL